MSSIYKRSWSNTCAPSTDGAIPALQQRSKAIPDFDTYNFWSEQSSHISNQIDAAVPNFSSLTKCPPNDVHISQMDKLMDMDEPMIEKWPSGMSVATLLSSSTATTASGLSEMWSSHASLGMIKDGDPDSVEQPPPPSESEYELHMEARRQRKAARAAQRSAARMAVAPPPEPVYSYENVDQYHSTISSLQSRIQELEAQLQSQHQPQQQPHPPPYYPNYQMYSPSLTRHQLEPRPPTHGQYHQYHIPQQHALNLPPHQAHMAQIQPALYHQHMNEPQRYTPNPRSPSESVLAFHQHHVVPQQYQHPPPPQPNLYPIPSAPAEAQQQVLSTSSSHEFTYPSPATLPHTPESVSMTQSPSSPSPAMCMASQVAQTSSIKPIVDSNCPYMIQLENELEHTVWYAERPFPSFTLSLVDREGNLMTQTEGVKLKVMLMDALERDASDKLVGQAKKLNFVFGMPNGRAIVTGIRFSSVSSKAGGYFRLIARVIQPDSAVSMVQGWASEKIQVLSYRLYNTPKVSHDKLTPADSLSRMKGIGSLYAKRFAGLGIMSIADLANLDLSKYSEEGLREVLEMLRRDRGAMTPVKLQEYILQARAVVDRAQSDD